MLKFQDENKHRPIADMFFEVSKLIIGRKNTKNVYFVYNESFSQSGSTIMRVNQLSDIFRKHAGKEFTVKCTKAPINVSNSVVILNKNSIRLYSSDQIDELRKTNKVLIDPVDAKLDDRLAESVDGVIAASRSAYKDWGSRLKVPVFLVDHHPDPRIKPVNRHRQFKVGYFGELDNTIFSPSLEKQIDFINVNTRKQEMGWLKEVPSYTLHYAIRRYKSHDGYKPFTKGFIAAICNSNIIISGDDHEALSWLGDDYPYVCRDTSIGGILEMVRYAKSSYGRSEWHQGLDVMRRVEHEVSSKNIANQLTVAIKGVYGNE